MLVSAVLIAVGVEGASGAVGTVVLVKEEATEEPMGLMATIVKV
jgi:hypothetical protein